MNECQFNIKGLTKMYNGKKVLDIPQLSLKQGGIYGVIGPNGSGKTTLLSILGFLSPPTSGSIFFEAADTSTIDHHSLRRHITLVLQNPFLFDTTVEKNVAYGLRVRGISPKKEKELVYHYLRLVGLDGFAKRRARELSAGETQRVAIARSLVTCPKVLLLDEPTANIDKENSDILEAIIKELSHTRKITTVLATHDMHQAYRLSHEVIPLSYGTITEPPLENLFKGSVLKTDTKTLFDTGNIQIALLAGREDTHYIAIPPEDIIISTHPISTSAQNSLFGSISQIHEKESHVKLYVSVGEEMRVQISKESFQSMDLHVGTQVYLTFKSSSVTVF